MEPTLAQHAMRHPGWTTNIIGTLRLSGGPATVVAVSHTDATGDRTAWVLVTAPGDPGHLVDASHGLADAAAARAVPASPRVLGPGGVAAVDAGSVMAAVRAVQMQRVGFGDWPGEVGEVGESGGRVLIWKTRSVTSRIGVPPPWPTSARNRN